MCGKFKIIYYTIFDIVSVVVKIGNMEIFRILLDYIQYGVDSFFSETDSHFFSFKHQSITGEKYARSKS